MTDGRDNYELTQAELAAALNEWMRRYIEEPERFEREFKTIAQFQEEDGMLIEASYGRDGAAYLLKLHQEISTR